MNFYNVCDLVLSSNIPIVELLPATSHQPDCHFYFYETHDYDFAPHHWIHIWDFPDGSSWLRIAKTQAGFVLRFPELADFLLSSDAQKVECYSHANIPIDTIKHLLLDQVIPLLLNQRGKFVLHAGAVVLPGGAIAFLGASGFGKSTLTASFSQQGFPMLTDECVLLEEKNGEMLVIPSYPGLRLWPENVAALLSQEIELSEVAHYSSKKRLGWDTGHLNYSNMRVPLCRLYVLSDPDAELDSLEVRIEPLSPHRAYMEIFKHTFHLDITDHQRLAKEMSELSRLTELGLVYQLTYPRELTLLPQVREKILQHVNYL